MNAQAHSAQSVVYLLHIDPPYRHARHVIGWSANLRTAIGDLWSGRTRSGIIRAALDAESKVTVARKWSGGAEECVRIRGMRSAAKYCPICRKLKRRKRQDESLEVLLARSIERAEKRKQRRGF